MQALSQWDVQQEEVCEGLSALAAVDDAAEEEGRPPPSDDVLTYARTVVEGFWARRQSVDDRISAASANWTLARMSPVERNTMRVAVVEMLSDAPPPKVALDEAIEIAREFGGEDSPRFVNGVLDLVLKRLESGREAAG